MNYCITDQNNKVVNIIVYDGDEEYKPGEGLTLVGPLAEGEQAAIGWTYDEAADTFVAPAANTFVAPAAPDPME